MYKQRDCKHNFLACYLPKLITFFESTNVCLLLHLRLVKTLFTQHNWHLYVVITIIYSSSDSTIMQSRLMCFKLYNQQRLHHVHTNMIHLLIPCKTTDKRYHPSPKQLRTSTGWGVYKGELRMPDTYMENERRCCIKIHSMPFRI